MSAPKRQTMTWDADADRKLLLAILANCGEIKPDFDGIASMMGANCTVRAVQERIKKLRKLDPNEVSTGNTIITADQTSQAKTPGGGSAGKGKQSEDTEGVTNDDEGNETAEAVKKATRKRAAPKGKKGVTPKAAMNEEGGNSELVAVKKTPRKRAAPKSKKNEAPAPVSIKQEFVEESWVDEENARKKQKHNSADASHDPASEQVNAELLEAANEPFEEFA